MPVCKAQKSQGPSLIVRSYPDSSYFVIWQDYRNDQSSYNDEHAIIYIASSTSANLNVSPQLIADGNKGFFLSSYVHQRAHIFMIIKT